MTTMIRQELTSLFRSGQWVWPVISYLITLVVLTALAIRPAHAAYGFVAPVLLIGSAWAGWLITSRTQGPLWQITMIAVGGRERTLVARWACALLAAAPLFVLAVIAAEIGRQSSSDAAGLWWGGIGLHLLVAVLGAGIGTLLGVQLTEREGNPVPAGESTPLAALVIVLVCGVGAIGYAGAIGVLALVLITVAVSIAAVTTG
ncbi:MAG: hypothetical protein JWN47_237 [Frankiales bacterium]|nr:hypothetical protein [Frankiales bacterium]